MTALLSHGIARPVAVAIAASRARLIAAGDSETGTVDEKLGLLDQLGEFGLGQQLLAYGGLDGRWSHYVHVECAEWRGDEADRRGMHPLEAKVLQLWRGGRERLAICRRLLQPALFDGIAILSVPCGLFGELLALDLRGLADFRLVGVDLDPVSVAAATRRAAGAGLGEHTRVLACDAWHLPFRAEFDRVVSLGLNTYAPDVRTALALYRSLFQVLRPGGKLIVSYMTPPGSPERDRQAFTAEEQRLARILFHEILEIRFAHYNSSAEIAQLLESVGFCDVDCHFSATRSANVAVATRPLLPTAGSPRPPSPP